MSLFIPDKAGLARLRLLALFGMPSDLCRKRAPSARGGYSVKRGHCQGCGGRVSIDVGPDGHTRSEPDRSGNPMPVLCGPVNRDSEEEEVDDEAPR